LNANAKDSASAFVSGDFPSVTGHKNLTGTAQEIDCKSAVTIVEGLKLTFVVGDFGIQPNALASSSRATSARPPPCVSKNLPICPLQTAQHSGFGAVRQLEANRKP
jgi:hypothetical protein